MILIRICDGCGNQLSFDDDEIITCQWCGRDICDGCLPDHKCIDKENEEE